MTDDSSPTLTSDFRTGTSCSLSSLESCGPETGAKGDGEARCAKILPEIRLPATVQAIAPVKVQLSRQQHRQLGRKEAKLRVRAALSWKTAPSLSRRQKRELAREIHKQNWEKRDRELVKKIYQGFTPPSPITP